MTGHYLWNILPKSPPKSAVIVGCAASLAWAGVASAAPAVEPRVMTQLGLDVALNFNLLQNETEIIDNYLSSRACSKLPYGGSINTLSVTKISTTEYKSKIDIYFDSACKMPYVEANATVTTASATDTVSISEVASYRGLDGKPLATLRITDSFSVANQIETLRGLGTFTLVGGQPTADVGFTCSVPTTGNSLTLACQGGVAQTFKLLDLSIANVVPFTITASANTNAPKVTIAGTQSNVQTGPAGSLSITAPTPQTLAISGGGTAYTSTAVSGSQAHYALFPPRPTSWTVTDQTNNAQMTFSILSDQTRAARGVVSTISPAEKLAVITLDKSGSGKVTYSDKTPAAAIRSFLAAN